MIIFFIRLKIPTEVLNDVQIDEFRHGLYPPFKLEDDASTFTSNLDNSQSWVFDLEDFMMEGGVTTGPGKYIP